MAPDLPGLLEEEKVEQKIATDRQPERAEAEGRRDEFTANCENQFGTINSKATRRPKTLVELFVAVVNSPVHVLTNGFNNSKNILSI